MASSTKAPTNGALLETGTTNNWVDASFMLTDGSNYAFYVLSPGSNPSDYITVYDFGFSIPTDATIDGIEATIKKSRNGSEVRDYFIAFDGPAGESDNKADTVTNWETVKTTLIYGGPTDLWGLTVSPSDINDSSFALGIRAQTTTPINGTARLYYAEVTVYYTESGGGSSQTNSLMQMGCGT